MYEITPHGTYENKTEREGEMKSYEITDGMARWREERGFIRQIVDLAKEPLYLQDMSK